MKRIANLPWLVLIVLPLCAAGLFAQAPLQIVTSALPSGTVGVAYMFSIVASGGTLPYTFSATGLPLGLSMAANGNITGTPVAPGSSNPSVQVRDSATPPQTASRSIPITIIVTPLAITTNSDLPSGSISFDYHQMLAATGGTPPYRWSIVSGTRPPGLILVPETGTIGGTPTTAGAFTFVVRVTDGASATAEKQFTIAISSGLTITTASSLPSGIVGVDYSQQLSAAGGAAPYTWAHVSGNLPPGLTLDASSGIIGGSPISSATFNFTIRVTDNLGSTATKAMSITIAASLTITSGPALPAATQGAPYSYQLIAAGGVPPYTWSRTGGALPEGLALSPTGVISGTPVSAGTFNFTAQVTDSTSAIAARTLVLTIPTDLAITIDASLPGAMAGAAYSVTLSATGGRPPYSWAISSGLPPNGLTLNSATGVIAGTPASAGNFAFTVLLTDSVQSRYAKDYTLTVVPLLPALTVTGAPDRADPAQQLSLGLNLAAAYSMPVTARVTLSFAPDAVNPADDPVIQFATGGRTASVTVAANSTQAAIPQIATGTVAGTINVSFALEVGGVSITPPPDLNRSIRIVRSAPAIRSTRIMRTSSGFEIHLIGLSTTRELTQATVRFTPAPGREVQPAEVTVQLGDVARRWYQGGSSAQFGSQFELVLPFTSQGGLDALSAAATTLANTAGNSQSASANF